MDAGVFVLQADNSLIQMTERPYEVEELLQAQLADHPELLAGDQINPDDPRRWLLVSREVGIPAEEKGVDWWSLDHLFLDQDAIPTFVEVKRASDSRIRREVVAQMLDYAANAPVNWPIDRMRAMFENRCTSRGEVPGEAVLNAYGPETNEEQFWELAKENLRNGRIRLIFVADEIPPSLRRIVEFLNQQMSPAEVLAVEIRQFAADGETPLCVLVPRVIGKLEQQPKDPLRRPGQPVHISREDLERVQPELRNTASEMLQLANESGFVSEPMRSNLGYASVRLLVNGISSAPMTMAEDRIWVSLGRYHRALLEPDANQQIRSAILLISPACTQARNENKSEVGILFETISPEGLKALPGLFDTVRHALQVPTTSNS